MECAGVRERAAAEGERDLGMLFQGFESRQTPMTSPAKPRYGGTETSPAWLGAFSERASLRHRPVEVTAWTDRLLNNLVELTTAADYRRVGLAELHDTLLQVRDRDGAEAFERRMRRHGIDSALLGDYHPGSVHAPRCGTLVQRCVRTVLEEGSRWM